MRWVVLLLMMGCNSRNRNPELLAFNDQEPGTFLGIVYFEDPFWFSPGESIELIVDAEDPDRDPIQIWFAYQPPGLCFDPDGTRGVWHVPDDYDEPFTRFSLVLADDADPMGITAVEIDFWNIHSDEVSGEEWGRDSADWE